MKADDPKVATSTGRPATIQDGPAPEPINPQTGQHGSYWVLNAHERAKGFVRPVRRSYVHVGAPGPRYPTRALTEDEKRDHASMPYVLVEDYPEGSPEAGEGKTRRFWTQAMLDRVGAGCGTLTMMSTAIAETYARDPSFYGSTFCCSCRNHYPVAEFVWDGGDERVGS